MSSSQHGVKAKIRNHYQDETYVYCRSHVLTILKHVSVASKENDDCTEQLL